LNSSGFNMITKAKEKAVYCTHGRYFPNLTRQDGSAFEKYYVGMAQKKGHNRPQLRQIKPQILPNNLISLCEKWWRRPPLYSLK
jgi:hypothetical protein